MFLTVTVIVRVRSVRTAPNATGAGVAASEPVMPVQDSDTIWVGLVGASLVKVVAPVKVVAADGVQVRLHVAVPCGASVMGGAWPPRANCPGEVVIVLMVRLTSPWFSMMIEAGLEVDCTGMAPKSIMPLAGVVIAMTPA